MLHSLRQTLIYTAVTVSAGVAGSLGLAVFLNQPRRGVTLFRTIFYLPAVVSIVAAGAAFKLLFNSPNGLVDSVSMQFGGDAVQWLSDQHAFYALITMSLWSLGVGIVIFLAGLQGISQEVLEAAWVDGSSKLQTFLRITVPLLSPVILFQVVTGVIGSLQAYVQAIALTPGSISGGGGGGVSSGTPPESNTLFMVYAFQQFNSNQLFGYGCALLEIAFVVILVITIAIFRTSARWVYYEAALGGK
jgi:multiple sugar transport system permease protein